MKWMFKGGGAKKSEASDEVRAPEIETNERKMKTEWEKKDAAFQP